jgi:hypothetical protein
MVNGSGPLVRADLLAVEFDGERLVADAGVVLTGALVDRLGIARLVDRTVELDDRPGAARPGACHGTRNTRHVYWTETERETGIIGRTNLDGSDIIRGFITRTGSAYGLAVDARHVYWANAKAGTIGRADIDGGNVNRRFINAGAGPLDVAVGDNHIYWTNRCCVGRADLDGSNLDTNLVSDGQYYWGVAVDPTPDTRIDSATAEKSPAVVDPRERRPRRTTWRLRFRFSSSQPDSTFSCSLDGSRYQRCAFLLPDAHGGIGGPGGGT